MSVQFFERLLLWYEFLLLPPEQNQSFMKNIFPILLAFAFLFSSCVSTKKYKGQVSKYDSLNVDHQKVRLQLAACLDEKDQQSAKVSSLESEIATLKSNSTTLLKQLSDLSVLSATQSESIKKSLENISAKDAYIKDLQVEMNRKDSLNMALVMNLKGALQDVNDQDVQIKVEGSAVFISISDKMLFKSGSYQITPRAKEVLGKVADVIKAQPDLQFMVEGHTDNKPINTGFIKDNWDLSVLRSTAVVRVLQKNYGVDPARMIAAGRSEYNAVAANDNAEGRSLNRRTRIVILPQLDQFFKLLEPR
jgi:chemotaxis protein MotB